MGSTCVRPTRKPTESGVGEPEPKSRKPSDEDTPGPPGAAAASRGADASPDNSRAHAGSTAPPPGESPIATTLIDVTAPTEAVKPTLVEATSVAAAQTPVAPTPASTVVAPVAAAVVSAVADTPASTVVAPVSAAPAPMVIAPVAAAAPEGMQLEAGSKSSPSQDPVPAEVTGVSRGSRTMTDPLAYAGPAFAHLSPIGGGGSRESSKSVVSLDKTASYNLRKYAKRNRPANRDKFMTQPAMMIGQQQESASLLEPAAKALLDEDGSLPSTIEEKMIKYDIFDDIDADRLKEFDTLFGKVKQNSNYEAHKQKTKKVNKDKFNTAANVTTDHETGQTHIT